MNLELVVMFVGIIVLFAGASSAMASVVPSEKKYAVSLDGKWRFKIERLFEDYEKLKPLRHAMEVDTPKTFEPFYEPKYKEGEEWTELQVPGNWEMAGHSASTYDDPDNTSGFYRKWFAVPSSWKGRVVKLNFDGVQCGAEVWLNGQPVNVSEPSRGRSNYHESGWTAWQCDLTPHVEFGAKNLLAIRVTKNTPSSDLDSGDYFFLGGVYRTVTLFSVPRTHIENYTVRTHLLDEGKAEVKLILDVAGASGAKPRVAMRLDGAGPVEGKVTGRKVELTQVLDKPRLWSAEHPNLYQMTLELKDSSGNVTETVKRKIGVREISIKDGIFMVNGVPVKLVGICRHDVYPTMGTAVNEELWKKDMDLMKEANFNSIRCSHYPYGEGFYEMCDEMGFYVQDELPMCWCNMDDPSLTDAYLQRTRETVRRDNNYACIVAWGIGNENKDGMNQRIIADALKELDPTRPRFNSCKLASQNDVEMDDFHYVPPKRMAEQAQDRSQRDRWPVIYSENPNVWDVRFAADYGCLDLWEEVYRRTMDVIWEYDGVCGNFLWEWQDRAVADKYPIKPYLFDKDTGIHYLKTKGLVDGWRNPRPDYYHVKVVNSPIAVDLEADLRSKRGLAVIKIMNRYSFTNLSEIKANWRILKGGKIVRKGSTRFDVPPLSSTKVELPLPVKGDTLLIDFDHPDGWNVITCQFELEKRANRPEMKAGLPEGLQFPSLNFVGRKTEHDPVTWHRIERYSVRLVNTGSVRPLTGAARGAAQAVEGDLVMEKDPGTVVGHLKAQFSGGDFSYRIEWTGEKMDLQELGWVFDMPKDYDRLSWKREAIWSYYPETHIGRPEGTALPDTANVENTKITRPDAFDFVSTKYECDWCSLTDAAGHGLMVQFTPDDRHQARGAIGREGFGLVVNKLCCPPRDISTHAVTDLYKELEPGTVIEGRFRVGSR